MIKTEKYQSRHMFLLMIGLIVLGYTTSIAFAKANIRPATLSSIENDNTTLVPLITDCDGDACDQVTLTWDDIKQQYKVQNNSTDQWMRVSAENLAATATTCVAAGQAQFLSLKSIVTYRASYDATCANP
jgi:hypothetical protein